MSDQLPPLPSDIRDLISKDRHSDTLDDERRQRLARNVGAAILAGGAVGVAMSAGAKSGLLGASRTEIGTTPWMATAPIVIATTATGPIPQLRDHVRAAHEGCRGSCKNCCKASHFVTS